MCALPVATSNTTVQKIFFYLYKQQLNPYLSLIVTMEPTGPTVSSLGSYMTATLEQFSSYPNVITTKLICAAAELEQVDQPDATPIYHSPKKSNNDV